MILFPAIDLKDGACVRLLRGDMDTAVTYNPDPAGQAKVFEQAGFEWLHIVDLDGAVEGRPVNGETVAGIIEAVALPIQLGGGIRDLFTVEAWLSRGVRRVILGTAAVRNPALVREACREFPGQIGVGLDARNGRVAVEGWVETSEILAKDLARQFEDAGVAAIIYTDIDRDGAMQGLNVEATVDLAGALATPVIASGGVSGLSDLARIREFASDGIAGVISGRALYDGRLDPVAALEMMKSV